MKTILIVASRPEIAGGENYLLSSFRYLDRTRYQPIVWLPGDGAFREALEAIGVEYVIDPIDYGWLKPPTRWYEFLDGLGERVRRISDLIRSRDVRLVHTNSNQILEGALAARLCGVPHLYLAHVEFQPDIPLYQRFPIAPASFAGIMGELSQGVLAVSKQVRNSLCPAVPADRITVVNNGLEMARYDAAVDGRDGSLRTELGLSPETVLVTAAGRVNEDKGFDLLVEAASKVVQHYPQTVFLICGATDILSYRNRLEARIGELGLEGKVRLLGRRDDLPRVLAQSDVFVLSSRREGHPYVLLEAMACGLPTVATLCGGVEETLEESVTGYGIPIGSVDEMAASIGRLVSCPQRRHEMGEAARRKVKMEFTAERSALGLFDCYERLLNSPPVGNTAYGIDLLLQATTELGYLGTKVTELEERLKRAERAAELVLDNPLTRLARKLRGGRRSKHG